MTRIKNKSNIKHKKILKLNKGFERPNSKRFRTGNEKNIKSINYSYSSRKNKKRYIKKIWIKRIKGELKQRKLEKYNQFIKKLKEKTIIINRKTLSKLLQADSNIINNLI